jgi:hypothetical protein
VPEFLFMDKKPAIRIVRMEPDFHFTAFARDTLANLVKCLIGTVALICLALLLVGAGA